MTAEEKEQIEGFLKEPPRIRSPYDRLPAQLQAARLWALAQPRHRVADSFPYFEEEFAEVYAARQKNPQPLGDTPLVILLTKPGFGDPPPGIPADEWKRINEEKREQKIGFTQLSRNSKLTVAEKSGHHIQLDEPEVVTRAIREVIEAAKRK